MNRLCLFFVFLFPWCIFAQSENQVIVQDSNGGGGHRFSRDAFWTWHCLLIVEFGVPDYAASSDGFESLVFVILAKAHTR